MLERKQVISFLKILQISVNQTPEQIKAALQKAGWNEQDASEAVSVLQPDPTGANSSKPQVVAQVHTDDSVTETPKTVLEQPLPVPPPPQPQTSPVVLAQEKSPEKPPVSVVADKVSPITFTPNLVRHKQSGEAVVMTDEPKRAANSHHVLFTDQKLSPETISNLLGIDVDVPPNEIELRLQRRERGMSFWQMALVIVVAIAISVAVILYGMYLGQVGPFHPSAT
ncbi:MAG: hypothetical protein AAGA35_00100 [Patescibacteria group bacterium]